MAPFSHSEGTYLGGSSLGDKLTCLSCLVVGALEFRKRSLLKNTNKKSCKKKPTHKTCLYALLKSFIRC